MAFPAMLINPLGMKIIALNSVKRTDSVLCVHAQYPRLLDSLFMFMCELRLVWGQKSELTEKFLYLVSMMFKSATIDNLIW